MTKVQIFLTLTDCRCYGLPPQRGTSMSAQAIGLGKLQEKSFSPEGAALDCIIKRR